MKKIRNVLLLSLTLTLLVGCSDNSKKETKTSDTSEPKKETVKKKKEESKISSSTNESSKTVETTKKESNPIVAEEQQSEVNNTTPIQNNSDMPPSWYGTAEEWEQAKQQGWTAEDYEQQVKASENESGPIQPGDPNYVPPYADDSQKQFFNEFYSEHGREPTSGEIQSAWAKEHGLE